MRTLRLDAVPHIVDKDPAGVESARTRAHDEFGHFLDHLLARTEVALHICSLDGGRVEFSYEVEGADREIDDFLEVGRQFLRLSADRERRAAHEGGRLELRRRTHLVPVGDLARLHDGLVEVLPPWAPRYIDFGADAAGQTSVLGAILSPLVKATGDLVAARIAPGNPYLVPVPQTFTPRTRSSAWRHLCTALSRRPGCVVVRAAPETPGDNDVAYAGLCLQYALGSSLDPAALGGLEGGMAVQRAVLLRGPVHTVTVEVRGDEAVLVDAIGRDTDPALLEAAPTGLSLSLHLASGRAARRSYGHDLDLLDVSDYEVRSEDNTVARVEQRFVREELVSLLTPPFTFTDALPGVRHFVPQPFQEPALPKPTAEQVHLIGRLANGQELRLDREAFTRHLFVTGASGSGKSNTMMGIVRQLADDGVPVLIVDPVKRDFEPLMATLGLRRSVIDFRTRWLRFNPFVPAPNITLYAHAVVLARTLSMLFPTNAVAYEMLLGMVKHTYWRKIEEARGRPLDLDRFVAMTGRDLRRDPALAPTFAEFLDWGIGLLNGPDGRPPTGNFAREAVEHFERRWANVRRSVLSLMMTPSDPVRPIDGLFRSTALLEFGGWFDQNEVNAAIALVFSMLYEHRLSEDVDVRAGRAERRLHVALLDEAHRILPAHGGGGDDRLVSASQEVVDLLGQMIAECRSLGQGLIIGEQSASRIDPGVLINSSTKIVHSVLYGKDKEHLGAALSLSPSEQHYLSYLATGEALAVTGQTYQPVRVVMPRFAAENEEQLRAR